MAEERGLIFGRFYRAAPVCRPTRGSCLTGAAPVPLRDLHAERRTLADGRRSTCRRSCIGGVCHGALRQVAPGDLDEDRTGQQQRRAERGGVLTPAVACTGSTSCFSTEAKVPTWDPESPKSGKSYGTAYWTGPGKKAKENLEGDDSRVIMDRAIPFVQGAVKKDTPFLAVVWFHTPHEPVVGGPKYLEMYQDVKNTGKREYYAAITAMDEQIGRLRAELRRLGVAENTMVWFCSDNGPEHQQGPGSTGGLRGRKRSLYEGGDSGVRGLWNGQRR